MKFINNVIEEHYQDPDRVWILEYLPESLKFNDIMRNKAILAYDAYCEAVGGKSFNGEPLPTGEVFFSDPTKQKQADAWVVAVKAVAPAPPANAKERLDLEILELEDKATKLKNFLFNANKPDTMTVEHVRLLSIQLPIMESYLSLLKIRQALFV